MDLGIDGKRALVLGATKGLGWATAQALAKEGVIVGITGRDATVAKRQALELGAQAHGFGLDLMRSEQIDVCLAAVSAKLGPPDILVLNGGGPPPSQAIPVDADFWRTQFEAMFVGLTRIADSCLSNMLDKGWGRILIVSSTSIKEPIAGLAASNAIRAAMAGWAKTLAREIAGNGVTVNVVMPGSMATDRIISFEQREAQTRGIPVAEVRSRNEAGIPARRYGRPEEFGAVMAFLSSQHASYVTGAVIPVDGGSLQSS
jgi:3-oxoacyl-[acyl-carrier protein] reductase